MKRSSEVSSLYQHKRAVGDDGGHGRNEKGTKVEVNNGTKF